MTRRWIIYQRETGRVVRGLSRRKRWTRELLRSLNEYCGCRRYAMAVVKLGADGTIETVNPARMENAVKMITTIRENKKRGVKKEREAAAEHWEHPRLWAAECDPPAIYDPMAEVYTPELI